MESRSNQEKLEGWTKEEKFELLEALKEVGSHNVVQIQEIVSTKTVDEIKAALDYYRRIASDIPTVTQKKERKINLPLVPLSRWAKFIIDSHGFDELQTETATALRVIAEFEDKAPPMGTEKIDFRKIYHLLADALEGKPFLTDKYTMALFDKCIVETALASKAIHRSPSSFKRILETSCNPAIADVNEFYKPTDDMELTTLRYLSTKKNYNPLNLPETNLKFTT